MRTTPYSSPSLYRRRPEPEQSSSSEVPQAPVLLPLPAAPKTEEPSVPAEEIEMWSFQCSPQRLFAGIVLFLLLVLIYEVRTMIQLLQNMNK